MSEKYPVFLDVNNSLPDLHCPYCDIGLDWNDNLYSFNKEWIRCKECNAMFTVVRHIEISYVIEEVD